MLLAQVLHGRPSPTGGNLLHKTEETPIIIIKNAYNYYKISLSGVGVHNEEIHAIYSLFVPCFVS